MAVQMVRRDVQDRADLGMEIHDGLQLETGDLCHGHTGLLCIQGHLRVGDPDVPHHIHILKVIIPHDLPGEGGGGGLPIGPGDGSQSPFGTVIGQLDLPPDRDLRLVDRSHQLRP